MEMSDLERVFPEYHFSWEGLRFTIKPLTIGKLPKVAEAWFKIVQMKADGKSDFEIVSAMLSDILWVAGQCIDISLDDVPMVIAPDIADVILRQNLSPDILGKWLALGNEVAEMFGAGQIVGQTNS